MALPPIFKLPLHVRAPAWVIGFVVSSTLALFSAPVHAEDTTASSPIPSGIYSAGACHDSESFWIHASGISVDIIGDFVSMEIVELESRPISHGWQRIESKNSNGTYGYFIRTSKNGGFEYVQWLSDDVEEPPEEHWASMLPSSEEGLDEPVRALPELPLVLPDRLPSSKEGLDGHWDLTIYTRCESIPFPLSMSHGEAAAFLFSLEPAIRVCRSGHSSCIHRMFAAADVHRDDALSQAEWARLIRLAIYFVMIGDEGIPSDKLGAAQALGLFASPLAASAIVSSYDYDGDGKTSLYELARDMTVQGALAVPEIEGTGAGVRADLEQAMTRLRNLLQLLPNLP